MKNNVNKTILAESRAFANERFSGIDGFDNFSDSYNFADDNASGVNMTQYNSKTSEPYEIQVANANTVATAATIFNSYVNRTASNFGNVSGITITSAVAGFTYGALLAQLEHKNVEIGKIYIQVITGSNSAVTATIGLTTADSSAESTTRQLRPKKSPLNNQADVLEFECSFKINGYTNLAVTIPASTTVEYSFYPSATVDSGRKLGNVHEIKDYKGPVITPKPTLSLSPAAIAQLRG